MAWCAFSRTERPRAQRLEGEGQVQDDCEVGCIAGCVEGGGEGSLGGDGGRGVGRMDGSECWRERPRFCLDSTSPEIGCLQYYIVLNIIILNFIIL